MIHIWATIYIHLVCFFPDLSITEDVIFFQTASQPKVTKFEKKKKRKKKQTTTQKTKADLGHSYHSCQAMPRRLKASL